MRSTEITPSVYRGRAGSTLASGWFPLCCELRTVPKGFRHVQQLLAFRGTSITGLLALKAFQKCFQGVEKLDPIHVIKSFVFWQTRYISISFYDCYLLVITQIIIKLYISLLHNPRKVFSPGDSLQKGLQVELWRLPPPSNSCGAHFHMSHCFRTNQFHSCFHVKNFTCHWFGILRGINKSHRPSFKRSVSQRSPSAQITQRL